VLSIRAFIDGYNQRCRPFTWTKTADDILPRATRQPSSDAGHKLRADCCSWRPGQRVPALTVIGL
jgi:hypothetical protein